MNIESLLPLFLDSGMTGMFALLVWFELRKTREEIVAVLHRLDGFIAAQKD